MLNRRDKRAVIAGVTAVAGAMLMFRVLPWTVHKLSAGTTDLRERTTILVHARAEVASAAQLRDSVAKMTQELVALAPQLLNGRSMAEAVADLSATVNLAATRHQVRLTESAPLADTTRAGRLARVTLRAGLESDIRGLAHFLRALESGSPTLTIRSMHVVASDPASAERKPEALSIEITVSGWFLRGPDVGTAHGS